MHKVYIHELCIITVSIDGKMGEVNVTGEEFLSALFADSPKCQEQCSVTECSNCSGDNTTLYIGCSHCIVHSSCDWGPRFPLYLGVWVKEKVPVWNMLFLMQREKGDIRTTHDSERVCSL